MSTDVRLAAYSPTVARRVFLTLAVTRWLPVGLVVGILILWPLERGLSVPQTLTAMAFTGIVVFLLELPTSGFADAFGRRPVLIASAVVNVLASLVFVLASSFWHFVVVAVLTGVFRALDSGPLEAWFVDAVHASEPGADVDRPLSAYGTLLGLGIATGALLSGGLIWWDPLKGPSALLLPVAIWVALNAVHLIAVVILMKEPTHLGAAATRSALASAKKAPAAVASGLALLRSSAVLRGLVLVEVFTAIAMVVYEKFQPIRLAELVGGEEPAGALMGPVSSAGWAVFAAGSALAGLAASRIGVAGTAVLARIFNGLGAVVMGFALGPAGLIAAYLATYGLHGASNPVHMALLHREASARNRATVLSTNSMMSFLAYAVATPLLGLLAGWSSTQVAMVTAGGVSVLGALLYLPAWRQERAGRSHDELVGHRAH